MVEYEQHDRIAVLTLNRPEARNAVNHDVAAGIEAGIDRAEADDEIWAAVITHNGPAFSAGADLKVLATGDSRSLATERGGFAGIVRRERESRSWPRWTVPPSPADARSCSPATSWWRRERRRSACPR
jgi:enoyl-CoA hydratase